jgi:hypothetical protein
MGRLVKLRALLTDRSHRTQILTSSFFHLPELSISLSHHYTRSKKAIYSSQLTPTPMLDLQYDPSLDLYNVQVLPMIVRILIVA